MKHNGQFTALVNEMEACMNKPKGKSRGIEMRRIMKKMLMLGYNVRADEENDKKK